MTSDERFEKAFEELFGNEGGYAGMKGVDRGQETLYGVSRKWEPECEMWTYVDIAKQKSSFPKLPSKSATNKVWSNFYKKADKVFAKDTRILEGAKELYKTKYWNTIKAGKIDNFDLAFSIFDYGVNAGVRTSSRLAQAACGAKPDGVIGAKTIARLNEVDVEEFMLIFTLSKIVRYHKLCVKDTSQQVYMYNWLKRSLESGDIEHTPITTIIDELTAIDNETLKLKLIMNELAGYREICRTDKDCRKYLVKWVGKTLSEL